MNFEQKYTVNFGPSYFSLFSGYADLSSPVALYASMLLSLKQRCPLLHFMTALRDAYGGLRGKQQSSRVR